jgi:hypothetical protein
MAWKLRGFKLWMFLCARLESVIDQYRTGSKAGARLAPYVQGMINLLLWWLG